MITAIAVVISLIFLGTKFIIDLVDRKRARRASKILTWLTIPLVVLFIASVIVRVANMAPEIPLIF